MTNYQVILPQGWKHPPGYSQAYLYENRLVIAGQVPWNPVTLQLIGKGNIVKQWDQAFNNLVTVVKTVGGKPEDIILLRTYVTDMSAY